jgi:hypothetical protein
VASSVTKTFGFLSATSPLLFQASDENIIEKTIGTTFGQLAGKECKFLFMIFQCC